MNYEGALAERKAANYLRTKRYKLLDANFRSRFGEIDLVMTKGKYIVFIEVKARDVQSPAPPRSFVDIGKQERMLKTANYYLSLYPTKKQPRFDVVEVIYENEAIKSIKHLENAFTLD